MELWDLIEDIRDVLVSDDAINTWCLANYNKKPSICIWMDERSPESEYEYPLIHIYPVRKNAGLGSGTKTHMLYVVAGIVNENYTEEDILDPDSTTRIVKYPDGLKDVLTLCTKILAALRSEDLGVFINENNQIIDEEAPFPYFIVAWELELTQTTTLGADPHI